MEKEFTLEDLQMICKVACARVHDCEHKLHEHSNTPSREYLDFLQEELDEANYLYDKALDVYVSAKCK